ncbi:MAG TPA: hypothetical protein VN831_01710, partial [Bradyrhizobium sp.]|nr:hypothetical protein [Bradyrhizobium sp.]
GCPILCRPIALNLWHCLFNLWQCSKQTVNPQRHKRQRWTALFDHGGMAGSIQLPPHFILVM